MPRGKPFRNDLDPGRVINCAQRLVQHLREADARTSRGLREALGHLRAALFCALDYQLKNVAR